VKTASASTTRTKATPAISNATATL
jgi:hypothetical protein